MADAVGVEPTQSDLESNSPPGNMGAYRKDWDERDPKAKAVSPKQTGAKDYCLWF